MKLKSILLMGLSFAVTLAVAIGGTLAYLTSTDDDVNVMTLGNVTIEQIEQQRVDDNANQTVLEEFEDDKPLYPAVFDGSSINWAPEDEWVVAGDQAWKVVEDNSNVVDKFVTVKNTGKSDAFVRTLIAYEGDAEYGPNGAWIHIVTNGSNVTPALATKFVGYITVKDVVYTLYEYVYPEALASGETTIPSLKQVYMNKEADNDVVAYYGDTYDIIVISQAVQTAGFSDAKTALDTAFGDLSTDAGLEAAAEWFDGAATPKIPTIKVSTPEELRNAMDNPELQPGTIIDAEGVTVILENGEHYLIPGGIILKNTTFISRSRGGEYIVMTSGVGDTITLENCNIQREELGMVIIGAENADGPDMIFNTCTFNGPIAPNFVEKAEGNSQFNNCTFGVGTAFMKQGWVNAMGGTHTFTGCTFDYTGGSTNGSNQYVRYNAINSYSERYSTAVIVDGCALTNCGTQRYGSNSTLTVK